MNFYTNKTLTFDNDIADFDLILDEKEVVVHYQTEIDYNAHTVPVNAKVDRDGERFIVTARERIGLLLVKE